MTTVSTPAASAQVSRDPAAVTSWRDEKRLPDRGNAICRRSQRQLDKAVAALAGDHAVLATPEVDRLRALADRVVPLVRAQAKAFRKLSVPKGDAKQVEALATELDSTAKMIQSDPSQLLADSTDGDPYDELARDLGFTDCLERPTSDVLEDETALPLIDQVDGYRLEPLPAAIASQLRSRFENPPTGLRSAAFGRLVGDEAEAVVDAMLMDPRWALFSERIEPALKESLGAGAVPVQFGEETAFSRPMGGGRSTSLTWVQGNLILEVSGPNPTASDSVTADLIADLTNRLREDPGIAVP